MYTISPYKFLLENYTMPENVRSVQEFCQDFRISRAMFYKIQSKGLGPKVMKIGRRTLISHEAATEWRKNIEGASECTK
jgi:hypothetical protein